jgi:hypothetical protein
MLTSILEMVNLFVILLCINIWLAFLSILQSLSLISHMMSIKLVHDCSTYFVVILSILRYLKGTLFHGLYFSSQSFLQMLAYTDADWAIDPTECHSTTGF